VTGIDQSAGMPARASRKHPAVAVRLLALQDAADWHGRFDGLMCVDALECVAPEHWPGVAAALAATLRTGAPAYVTVELRQGPLPPPDDPRQVPGGHRGWQLPLLSDPAAGPRVAERRRVCRHRASRQ
jgi:hypothetical protein